MTPLEKAKKYMIEFPRSNFPADIDIAEKFNLSRSSIYRLRNEMIKNEELHFTDGHFIPKSYIADIKK